MLVQRRAGAPELVADVEVVGLEVVRGNRQAEIAGGKAADGGEQTVGGDDLVVAGASARRELALASGTKRFDDGAIARTSEEAPWISN